MAASAGQWKNITVGGGAVGSLRIDSNGFFWASDNGSTVNVKKEEMDTDAAKTAVTWLQVGQQLFELQVFCKDGRSTRFDAFKTSDVHGITEFLQQHYNVRPSTKKASSCGKNWGLIRARADAAEFFVEDKDAVGHTSMEIDFRRLKECVVRGASQIELQLKVAGANKSADTLTQIQLYVPDDGVSIEGGGEDGVELAMSATERLQDHIRTHAGLKSTAGERLCELKDDISSFKAPRGKYSVDLFDTNFRMVGKSYEHSIQYDSINALYLLDQPGEEKSFVISLKEQSEITQGAQHYQHIVMNMKKNKKDIQVRIARQQEVLSAKYKNKNGDPMLHTEMVGQAPEMVATLFKALSGRKVIMHSKRYRTERGDVAVRATCGHNTGLLYPLAKSLIFIPKPCSIIRYNDIESIEFKRYEGQRSSNTTFDLEVRCSGRAGGPRQVHEFTGISKKEYDNLCGFLQGICQLNVRNLYKDESKTYQEVDSDGPSEDEAAMPGAMAGDDDYDSAADSDFDMEKAKADDSSSGEDSDEDDDEDYSSDEDKKKKKKKKKESKAKRKAADAGATSTKKKRRKKDINAPKRNISAYMAFNIEESKKLRAQGMTEFKEISQTVSAKWRAMSEEERKPYKEEEARQKAIYLAAKAEYEKNRVVDSDDEDGGKSSNQGKKKKKKKKKGFKGASSAYIFFGQHLREKLKAEGKKLGFKEFSAMQSEEWKKLDAEGKKPFTDKAEADKLRAAEDKAKWVAAHKDDESESDISSESSESSESSDSDSNAE